MVNKKIGTWYDYSTLIDDIAYQLYINEQAKVYGKLKVNHKIAFVTQKHMMFEYKNFETYSQFYNDAVLIIRKLKIEKILNKI